MRSIRMLIAVIGLGSLAFTAMGCRTMEGAGEDISRGGDKLASEAREHR